MSFENIVWPQLATTYPIALLPVRLEARFFGTELHVRIYPDEVHVDSHEIYLTQDEKDAGKHYWNEVTSAGSDKAAQATAWDRLLAAYEPERAAWIARVMEPLSKPDGTPAVPDPKPVTRRWNRAPLAQALPSRWYAVGIRGSQVTTTMSEQEVSPVIAVGPNPQSTASPSSSSGDPDMLWMTDFSAALKSGMALTLPLPGDLAQGLDRLLVFGVSETLHPQDSERLLANLLDAHFHTHGLSFVPQGTPTNNTEGARAGYDPNSAAHARRLRVKPASEPPSDGNAAAQRISRALGVALLPQPGDALCQVRGELKSANLRALGRAFEAADDESTDAGQLASDESIDAGQMNDALWPVTWGYFLWQMMAGTGLQASHIDYVREHYAAHVRASGPLPALRIGKQPYGILPVTALNQWTAGGIDGKIVDILRRLRNEIWLPSSGTVPRSDSPGDPRERLLRILGMAPVSPEIRARNVLGTTYVAYLWRFFRLGLTERWRETAYDKARTVLGRLGLPQEVRATQTVFAAESLAFDRPAVQAPGANPADYLAWLGSANTPWGDNLDGLPNLRTRTEFSATSPSPLLYLLARHGALVEYAMAAAIHLKRFHELPEPELIDIFPDDTTYTLWRQLATKVIVDGKQPNLGDAIGASEHAAGLKRFREAVRGLAKCDIERLERLLAQSIDLASHRLDAWITSFANKRLWSMRAAAPTGIHLGGYGWLVNLRPCTEAPTADGYIHAPSLPQAVTAAVLRAGWRSHGGGLNALSLDLSSQRVRLAQWLLDGVRQGQPLGALLGYRFERHLQEREGHLARVIPHLRALAPLSATALGPDGQPTETVAATHIVDGLKLLTLPPEDRDPSHWPIAPALDTKELKGLEDAFRALADARDAVGDVLLAESVHHAVQGNPMHASAVMDAAMGQIQPPELEFVRTPRTGVAVTHRLIMAGHLPAAATLPEWPAAPYQVRAAAEPALNALAASFLPVPQRVACRVVWRTAEGDTPRPAVTLDALRCAPLDVVYMAGEGAAEPGSELHRRFTAAAHGASGPLPTGVTLHVHFDRAPEWGAEILSVNELLEVAGATRALILGARALTIEDLELPNGAATTSDDGNELEERATHAMETLATIVSQMDDPDPAEVHEAMARVAGYGIHAAYPVTVSPTAEVAAARATAMQRLDEARRLAADFDRAAATPGERRAHDVARLQALFGPDFRVLPPFHPASPDVLEAALAARDSLKDGDRLAAETWLHRAARVRAGASRLHAARTYRDALHGGIPLLRVAQLPFQSGERWLGLDQTDPRALGSRLSLVVDGTDLHRLSEGDPVAGLVVDEWTEVIPSTHETTGLAFRFDAPGACAPQAILLAVPAEGQTAAAWTPAALQAVLDEALDLVRIRAVDPEVLIAAGHILPAAYVALNVPNETASTNFVSSAES
jgi:hypothetical protein